MSTKPRMPYDRAREKAAYPRSVSNQLPPAYERAREQAAEDAGHKGHNLVLSRWNTWGGETAPRRAVTQCVRCSLQFTLTPCDKEMSDYKLTWDGTGEMPPCRPPIGRPVGFKSV